MNLILFIDFLNLAYFVDSECYFQDPFTEPKVTTSSFLLKSQNDHTTTNRNVNLTSHTTNGEDTIQNQFSNGDTKNGYVRLISCIVLIEGSFCSALVSRSTPQVLTLI